MGSAHTLRGFSLKGVSCRGTHCKMCDFWHLSCSQQHRPKFMFSVLHPTLQGHEENNVLFFLHFPTHPLFPYVPTYLFKLTFLVCGQDWISLSILERWSISLHCWKGLKLWFFKQTWKWEAFTKPTKLWFFPLTTMSFRPRPPSSFFVINFF